ncbi:MAG: hypothetical protein EWV40_03090 [Microcystis flos-aquae Mf_WU_F_19750830_S460]|uniref:Uncharacterized protein n=1 Tax=Microcystis flos-aquae Mf_WU_F_19750830_S460 TaxID=2486237 RepID=A0A552M1I8_9CHRO|nr:MAG: hypothetical protein EWV40_03090 [Microcystis flos-aquae Mf_WU_F_19750830_S460]
MIKEKLKRKKAVNLLGVSTRKLILPDYLGFAAKSFSVVAGCFREKVPEFFPRSLPDPLLFDGQKV